MLNKKTMSSTKTAETINNAHLEFLKLKGKFIGIGVFKFPGKTLETIIPPHLQGKAVLQWIREAAYVWNGRSNKYADYLPVFEHVLDILKDETKIT